MRRKTSTHRLIVVRHRTSTPGPVFPHFDKDSRSDRQETTMKHSKQRPQREEPSQARRYLAGSVGWARSMLGGCGGHGDSGSPPPAPDPIWGASGSATQIVNALQNMSLSMFPNRQFLVTDYGAKPCGACSTRRTPTPTRASRHCLPARIRRTRPVPSIRGPRFSRRSRPATWRGGGQVVVPTGNWSLIVLGDEFCVTGRVSAV